MRLLFIADVNASNASVWLEYLADDLGHEVHVIAMRPQRRGLRNVTVYDLGTNSKPGYFLRLRQIKRVVGLVQPDLLIGYRIQSFGFLAAATGFRPLALAGQCETIVWPPWSLLHRAFCRFAVRRADLILAWSEIMARNVERLGAPPDRIVTGPRGVNTDLFRPGSAPPGNPAKTLITTRGLAPEYHHDAVLQAMPLIRDRLKAPLRYLILGEGPQRLALLQLAVRLGVQDEVQMLGLVPHEQVAAYLQASQVYVSLVSTEGVSASLLEAMACGVFPVVPDVPANRAWISDGVNGFLLPMAGWRANWRTGFQAPPRDPTLLAQRLARALADDRLRARAREINVTLVHARARWQDNMARIEQALRATALAWEAKRSGGTPAKRN